VIASLLAPAASSIRRRAHRICWFSKSATGGWCTNFRSIRRPKQPLVFDENQTYTGDRTPLTTTRTYQWIHSLSRIVGALVDAGLNA